MVKRSVFSPYKLSRAGDCFPCLEEIPEVAVWRSRPGPDRQHHSDALSEQGRRDQVQVLFRFRIKNPHRFERSTKWSLDSRVSNLLFDIWGLHTVDLFATRLNNKVEAFFSRLPDPLALHGIPYSRTGPRVYCTFVPRCPSCPLLSTRRSERRPWS